MITRPNQLPIVLLVLLTLLLTNCGKGNQEQEDDHEQQASKQITIIETQRSLQNAPLYVAMEKGFLKNKKLNVKLENQSDLTLATAALHSGQGQILVTTCDKILYLYQQDQKNFILIGQISTSAGYFLLARKAGPFQWQDFSGKVILGYRGGDLPYTLLYAELRNKGLRPFLSVHSVENLAYASIPAVYRAGSGHFLLAEEPLVSSIETEGLGQIITDLKLTNSPLPAHTVMVSKDYLHSNSTVCRSFLQALELSKAWLDQESPAEIAATLKPYFPEYPEKIIQRAAGRYKNAACWGDLIIQEQAFHQLQELMLKEKELRQLIPADQLLDSSLLGEN